MNEKYKSKIAVFLMIFRTSNGNKQTLMQKRSNTGWMDGMYDFACSGYLEKDESLSMAICREAKEEIGINIQEKDISLVFLCHPYINKKDHLDVFFTCKQYQGTPKIIEPEKCTDLAWFDLNSLPEDTIPELRNVLFAINKGLIYDDDKFSRTLSR